MKPELMTSAVITAHKSQIGHTFCAAGAVESAFGILAMKNGLVPRTVNLDEPLDQDLRFATSNVTKRIAYMVKTSLAFGGVNAALVFKNAEVD